MKKLNLLSKAEMKKVIGGNVPVSELEEVGKSTCIADCPNGGSITCYGYNGHGCSTSDGRGCTGNDANGNNYWNAC